MPGRLRNTCIVFACAISAAGAAYGQEKRVLHDNGGVTISASPEQAPPQTSYDDPTIPPSLSEAFSRHLQMLDSPRWQERVAAAEWLIDAEVSDGVFLALVHASYLTPEQRHHLLKIARDRVLTARRGALGIQMRPTADGFGVMISDVLPRMPAIGKLKPGDRVTHVNGVPIPSYTRFGSMIAEYRPGNTITLRLQRPIATEAEDEPEDDPPLRRLERFEVVEVAIMLADDEGLGAETVAEREVEQARKAREITSIHALQPEFLPVPEFAVYVERDRHIVELRAQLEQYQTADLTARRDLLDGWRKIRRDLLEAALEQDITVEERERRREVYEAYVQLLPAGL